MENVLEAKALCKSYAINNKQFPILKNINFHIKKGEFLTVMGRSGSGKSTLLYTVSGMDKLTSGNVLFEKKEFFGMSEKKLSDIRLNKMGFIFQQAHLLKNLSILDNIILTAYLRGKVPRAEINDHALALMKKMGIEELTQNDVTQASGGQLQRVGICRALINNPKIIFADEPTGALNTSAASEVMDLLTEINHAGTAILLVTHDIKVAARTERILFMSDGNIIAEEKLGKFTNENSDIKEREEKLANWLIKLGF